MVMGLQLSTSEGAGVSVSGSPSADGGSEGVASRAGGPGRRMLNPQEQLESGIFREERG